ncbi:MAG: heme-binding domain-containing protein [Ferruginibacter sp.]
MKRFFKILFYTILIALLIFQLYPKPTKNLSSTINANDITLAQHVPPEVEQVLKTSCYDCHSNNTVYPWYASVQPVAMWLGDHISEGKHDLNFSEFGGYSMRKKYKKLEEINELVKEDKMPLSSYTLIHRDAKLDESKKLLLANWVTALRDSMKANYPADSLVRKKNYKP